MMKVSKADLTELKALASPSLGTIKVLNATFLLLGHKGLAKQHFNKVKRLLAELTLLSVLKELNPDTVPVEAALGARKMMEGFTDKSIKCASKAAYSLHQWNTSVIDSVLSRHSEEEIAKTVPWE